MNPEFLIKSEVDKPLTTCSPLSIRTFSDYATGIQNQTHQIWQARIFCIKKKKAFLDLDHKEKSPTNLALPNLVM